jgi:orotidine-5'-phosphate decarboxylase
VSADLDFGGRLDSAFAQFGHLCVGIDPHPYLFDRWGFDDSPRTLREFSLRVLDACMGRVGIIKPQVAFYERWGAHGYAALENLISSARAAGLIVIADAKRGDIGSTMQAYAHSWLSAGSPLESDAVTVSPYLGLGALDETMDIARSNAKGVFVLAATSNPEAAAIQTSVLTRGDDAGLAIARTMVERVNAMNQQSGLTSGGVVIGATVSLEDYNIEPNRLAGLPVLAPGFGFQGAEPRDASRLFGELTQRLIVTETRRILESGPDSIVETVSRRAQLVAEALA